MLRATFLALSQNEWLRDFSSTFGPARNMARRFVAGERLEDAVDAVARLNAQGLLATLDFLGENTSSEAEAERGTQEQLRTLDCIRDEGLRSGISCKLTAIGLDISEDLARSNLRRLLQRARAHGSFVRIDMESSAYVDRTLAAHAAMRAEGFDNVGVVIQSALRRSASDVQQLVELGASVRLVKGAYAEPSDVAFPSKSDVDANYVQLAETLLGPSALAKGAYCAIATHDTAIIDHMKAFAAEHRVPLRRFEFQMLHGISTNMQRQLSSEGYRFRVYVPFGTHWYPYFMRRIAERPANALFVVKNLFTS